MDYKDRDINMVDMVVIRLNLTQQDREVINRLKDMGGFNEADVIQAYIACDKNEEMTTNQD